VCNLEEKTVDTICTGQIEHLLLQHLKPSPTSIGAKVVFDEMQQRFVATELVADMVIIVGDAKFYLHKSPLLPKCSLLQRLVASSNKEKNNEVDTSDIPGGPSTFELGAKFCYGVILTHNEIGARKTPMAPSGGWVKDLCELKEDLFKCMLMTIKANGSMPAVVIGEVFRGYAYRRLLGSLEDVVSNGVDCTKHRAAIDAIVFLLPAEDNSVRSGFLIMLLRAACLLESGKFHRINLIKRIGTQLDGDSVLDLLIPLNTNEDNMSSIDLNMAIVEKFMLQNGDSVVSVDPYWSQPNSNETEENVMYRWSQLVRIPNWFSGIRYWPRLLSLFSWITYLFRTSSSEMLLLSIKMWRNMELSILH
jgi:hypothetical protein